MFKETRAFSGFSVNDLEVARRFYSETLGLKVVDEKNKRGLELHLASGAMVFIYLKENHTPASFTILNFPVDDIDEAVDRLVEKGVVMEQYDNPDSPQDEKGIARAHTDAAQLCPDIAWFKDPAGNVLAVLRS